MSNKTNIMSLQFRQWITNERTKVLHPQHKVILPRLAGQDGTQHHHVRRGSLRKKDEELLVKSINNIRIGDSGKPKHKNQSRVDTSKSNTSMTDSAIKDSRSEKTQIVKEMKSWIKVIDAANKDSSSIAEIPLPKLENALYKWCLYIEQNVCCNQKSEYNISTPHPHHSLSLTLPKNPEETPCKSSDSSDSLLKEQKEYYEKQIRKLSMRIQQTQEEIETNRVYNRQSLKRIAQLQHLFHEWSGRVKRDAMKQKQENEVIDALLAKNEQFLHDIKQTITQGKETSAVVQKIEEKLEHLKDYKMHILVAQ